MKKSPLTFQVIAECKTSKARTGILSLPHAEVSTPVFMPVGTQGTVKGLLPQQLESLDCHIILGNTYHLGTRPGSEIVGKAGGLHEFMGWKRAMLTDSGGFQMVSLLELSTITEEGVKFKSPYEGTDCMLTPEHSIKIQNDLGADIAMQLDDVVSSTTKGPRVEEAMLRTTRWLDRCLEAHFRPDDQNIFPIVQGGLDPDLRKKSAELQTKRNVRGFAVGGLSGGEDKADFWRMVNLSTDVLPKDKPRYLMGVGFPEDMLVCCALGIDMFDCVHPTRTARFGNALTLSGKLKLRNSKYKNDFEPIEKDCDCSTCKRYTRSFLNSIVTWETVGSHLLSVHNIAFQMRFMKMIRENIKNGTFPELVKHFMNLNYPDKNFPEWVRNALYSVGIDLNQDINSAASAVNSAVVMTFSTTSTQTIVKTFRSGLHLGMILDKEIIHGRKN